MNILKENLIVCCETYGIYRLSAESLNSKMVAFAEVLSIYPETQVHSAFLEWRSEEIRMPVPADIRKILVRWKPEKPYERPPEPAAKSWDELTENEQEYFRQAMETAKNNLKTAITEDKKLADFEARSNGNTTHYDLQTADQKAQIQDYFIQSAINLKMGKNNY